MTRQGRHDYVVIDAFASEPLHGNPVAVFYDADDLPAERMQRIAQEMNLSEVTFVLRPRSGGHAWIRIFTPVNELPFAGHPLLGTAIALAGTHGGELRLETAMGVIPFHVEGDGDRGTASMEQPVPAWHPFERTGELLQALGVDAATLPVEIYTNGPRHVLVGLGDMDRLSRLRPDHRALAVFPDMAINCFAGAGTTWRNRMFSPAYGVVEDAATGSAAGPLAVHLGRHNQAPYDTWIDIHQGVEMGRHALMRARAQATHGAVRQVLVAGHGVLVARGVLHV